MPINMNGKTTMKTLYLHGSLQHQEGRFSDVALLA